VIYNKVNAPVHFGFALAQLDDNGVDSTFDLEVTAFDMQGGTMPAGLRLRESPTLPSKGCVSRSAQADGTYRIGSFFDIFTEISLDGGQT